MAPRIRMSVGRCGYRMFLAAVTALIILSIPAIIAMVLVLLLIQTVVRMVAKITRPGLQIFSEMGTLFDIRSVYDRPRMNFVCHFVCDGPVSVNRLRDRFQRALLLPTSSNSGKYDRFKKRWTFFMGYAFWEQDPTFRIERHIRKYDYGISDLVLPPSPTEEDLETVTGKLITRPFVEGQSPWELLVISNYKSRSNNIQRKQSVITLRIHHGLADGISISKFIARLSLEDCPPVLEAQFLREPSSWLSRCLRLLSIPCDITTKTFVNAWDEYHDWHCDANELQGSYHTFFGGPLETNQIKEIGRKNGVCYNAVIFSLTVGAITRSMKEMGGEVPEKLSLFYPYPARNHTGGLVNNFSGDFLTIHTKSSVTSLMRLREMSRHVKSTSVYVTTALWLEVAMKIRALLPSKLALASGSKFHYSLAMLNIPGPVRAFHVQENAQVTEVITALGSCTGSCGVIATLMSTAGSQRITLTLDDNLLKGFNSKPRFAHHLESELKELLRN